MDGTRTSSSTALGSTHVTVVERAAGGGGSGRSAYSVMDGIRGGAAQAIHSSRRRGSSENGAFPYQNEIRRDRGDLSATGCVGGGESRREGGEQDSSGAHAGWHGSVALPIHLFKRQPSGERRRGCWHFAQMREALSREATVEPKLGARGASSSGSSGSSGGSAKPNNRQLRINALQQQLRALEEADEEDGASADEQSESSFSAAPIATGNGTRESRCSKCGKAGHAALDCRSKAELRNCYGCGQTGHIKSKCPKLKQKGQTQGATAAASGKPSPKNE